MTARILRYTFLASFVVFLSACAAWNREQPENSKLTLGKRIFVWLTITEQTPLNEEIHKLTTAIGIRTHYSTHLIFVKRRLVEIGAPAVPTLISVLTREFVPFDKVLKLTTQYGVDFDPARMPYEVEIVLGRIGQPAVLPLSGLLGYADSKIRTRMVNALKRIGTPEAMEVVQQAEATR